MFSFGPEKLTKRILLNYRKEEEYFAFYLGVNPSTKQMIKSPLREDPNPGCTFYRSRNGELKFKDFARNKEYTFVDVVCEIYDVSFKDALKIIAIDFGLIVKPGVAQHEAKIEYDGSIVEDTGQTILQCCVKEFTKEEIEWWDVRGVSKKTLKKYNVFSVSSVFVNGINVGFSTDKSYIFGYYFGKKDGIEQWKIYFPQRPKGHKFLCNTDILQGLRHLPKDGGEVVVVTKSYKDVMALSQFDIPAVAPHGESVLISRKVYESLSKKFKLIIFNGDWDTTGKYFMINSLKQYDGIALTFRHPRQYAKDFSDFILVHGKRRASTLISILNSKLDGFLKKQNKNREKREKREKRQRELLAAEGS